VINGAVEHTTKLMQLQWGHGMSITVPAPTQAKDSSLHGLRQRRQDYRWCSSQDPVAFDPRGEPSVSSDSCHSLTVARRQEPSHRFLLCRSQDIGKADVEYQAVECGSGEPTEG